MTEGDGKGWRKGKGSGLRMNADGYLEIVRRGPLRWKKAHRAYVERQIGRPLESGEEVHHLCRNRSCWPPTDFHLVLIDARLHHAFEAGAEPWRRRRVKSGKGWLSMLSGRSEPDERGVHDVAESDAG